MPSDPKAPRGSDPDPPGSPPPEDPQPPKRRRERQRDGGTAGEARERVKRPQRFKVILYNDDYTRMEFVVAVLEQIFGKSPAEATQLMLQIHKSGQGLAGLFVQEVAETKVAAVHRAAEENGFPLRCEMEPE